MTVLFEATHIVNVIEVTPDLKQYYENLITVIARSFLDADTIEQIEKIVVPEDFLSAVMDFQIKNGDKNPSVTNNEFGRAFGKLLFNPETKKYVVFIDVMLATFIMDDTVFNACFNRLDEAALEEAKKKRQVSLNILAHELAHVEFALTVVRPKYEKTLQSGLTIQSYNLLDEYYACRRASTFCSRTLADDDESFILDLEEKIDNERWRYKKGNKDLNDFCKEFHQFSEMALIRLVSVLGMYAADENDQLPFPNTFLGKQAGIFKISFDLLFQRIVNGQKIYDSMMPIKAIENYYKDLGVIIFETEEGFYYSIPD